MTINIYAPLTGDGIESEELKLYNLLNTYRQQRGLPAIALSASLTLVANRHVQDLQENVGYLTHGWSDAPYSSNDPSTWPNMWSAPQRFNTAYTGYGYENAYQSSAGATAEGALKAWQNSSGHNAVILNLGIWADNSWNAIGIGIYGNYAVMWVGEQSDSPDQYGASYDDLIQTFGYNPIAFLNHYNKIGKFEGRQPDRFDELRYLASNSDLIQAFGHDPAAATKHYIQNGHYEGREKDSFDSVQYLASHDDLLGAFGYNPTAATQHYVQNGYYEGRAKNSFSADQYLASHDDLLGAFGYNPTAATQHYVQNGYYEGRPKDTFDEARYLASHGDLISVFSYNLAAATQHYIVFGKAENRSPHIFDAATYLNNYADLQTAFGSSLGAATRHYIEHGYDEGRTFLRIQAPILVSESVLSIPGVGSMPPPPPLPPI